MSTNIKAEIEVESVTYFEENRPEISGYGEKKKVIVSIDDFDKRSTVVKIGEMVILPQQLEWLIKEVNNVIEKNSDRG